MKSGKRGWLENGRKMRGKCLNAITGTRVVTRSRYIFPPRLFLSLFPHFPLYHSQSTKRERELRRLYVCMCVCVLYGAINSTRKL